MSSQTLDRPRAPVETGVAQDVKPVMLLTIDVPFDRSAAEFAIETAVETGAELYICMAVPIGVGTPGLQVARSFGERITRNDADEVGLSAKRLGVRVTQLVFHNPKPVRAALEVIRETGVGLVVFGSDRRQMSRWSFKRIAKRIRRECVCLVWTNE